MKFKIELFKQLWLCREKQFKIIVSQRIGQIKINVVMNWKQACILATRFSVLAVLVVFYLKLMRNAIKNKR